MINYWDFRNQVISKNLGSHSHEIHGCLGIILNTVSFQGYKKYKEVFNKEEQEQEQHMKNVGKALRTIYKITGVEPDGDIFLPRDNK
jgi:hypothetical protein